MLVFANTNSEKKEGLTREIVTVVVLLPVKIRVMSGEALSDGCACMRKGNYVRSRPGLKALGIAKRGSAERGRIGLINNCTPGPPGENKRKTNLAASAYPQAHEFRCRKPTSVKVR